MTNLMRIVFLFALIAPSCHIQARRTITVNNKQISTGQVYELSALMHDRNSLDEFYAIVDAADKVLLDFYASWCRPCQDMMPDVKSLAQENEHVFFIKINFEEFRIICTKLGVKSLPTFMSYNQGQEVARIAKGRISKKELKKLSRIL